MGSSLVLVLSPCLSLPLPFCLCLSVFLSVSVSFSLALLQDHIYLSSYMLPAMIIKDTPPVV